MEVFFIWIILSFVVGFVGSGRKVGFAGAFFLSLILSPLIGLIVAAFSKSKDTEQYQNEALAAQYRQAEALKNLQDTAARKSVAEELESLQKMRATGDLTDEEYQQAKARVLAPDPE